MKRFDSIEDLITELDEEETMTDEIRLVVKVELKETSQGIVLIAKNTYTKGPFFCVYTVEGKVQKFPIANVWRVTEDYGRSNDE